MPDRQTPASPPHGAQPGDSAREPRTDSPSAAAWQAANAEAIAASNAYVERHGLPLAAFRLF